MRLMTFAVSPRSDRLDTAWADIAQTIALAERFGLTGVLAFAGNDVAVDPWFVAQHACHATRTLQPLVAVNPIYMHPFQVAKLVATIGHVERRKVHLNLITGTANRDRAALCDTIDHDARYERLIEFAQIIRQLLAQARPTSFDGQYYKMKDALCYPRLPADLLPDFFIAGQSDAATRCAAALGAVAMRMLSPDLGSAPVQGRMGLYCGVIIREHASDAWRLAEERFPPDPTGNLVAEMALARTDSVWKHRLSALAATDANNDLYWLRPLRTLQADCPYLVGDRRRVAEILSVAMRAGYGAFIFDIAPEEEDFANLAHCLSIASQALAQPEGVRQQP
jgi:alkanesulfonate monooxygenase